MLGLWRHTSISLTNDLFLLPPRGAWEGTGGQLPPPQCSIGATKPKNYRSAKSSLDILTITALNFIHFFWVNSFKTIFFSIFPAGHAPRPWKHNEPSGPLRLPPLASFCSPILQPLRRPHAPPTTYIFIPEVEQRMMWWKNNRLF